jgi:hypothetical protein
MTSRSRYESPNVTVWTVIVHPFRVTVERGRAQGAQRFYSYYCSNSKQQYDYYVLEFGSSGVSAIAWSRASVETYHHIKETLPTGKPLRRYARKKSSKKSGVDADGNEQKALF